MASTVHGVNSTEHGRRSGRTAGRESEKERKRDWEKGKVLFWARIP
jgi:hypothetical protein